MGRDGFCPRRMFIFNQMHFVVWRTASNFMSCAALIHWSTSSCLPKFQSMHYSKQTGRPRRSRATISGTWFKHLHLKSVVLQSFIDGLSDAQLIINVFIMARNSFTIAKKSPTLLLMFFLLVSPLATAHTGTCRYDADRCSCKLGDENQGVCWDADEFWEGFCNRRPCDPGWTCACGGRTHLCYRKSEVIHVLSPGAVAFQMQVPCTSKMFPLVSARDIMLGTVRIHVSETGIRADDCTQLAWWHNGDLMGSFERLENRTNVDYAKEVILYERHSMIELRPGDLVAFWFRGSSYYCYKHLTQFVVNTTTLSSMSQGVTTHYARKHSQDWFRPSYRLNAANMGVDESETVMEKFIPLRTKLLTSHATIVPGVDYWAPRDDSNRDNVRSNWYFRIQIPLAL